MQALAKLTQCARLVNARHPDVDVEYVGPGLDLRDGFGDGKVIGTAGKRLLEARLSRGVDTLADGRDRGCTWHEFD